MSDLIKFENVSKIYKETIIALDSVNFTAKRGEFFFVIGPSGAGKSTLVRLIIRQELPTQGDILFESILVTGIPRKMLAVYRQQLGVVFQDLKLIPSKTVRENVQFALEIANKPKNEIDETTDYLLETVGLKDRQALFPEMLSGGEMQKTAIARALANDPKLLIADEPTGNLDPDTSFEILELLKTINSWGTTVMVVSHDKDLVNAMQTRVLQMEHGKIINDKKGGYLNNGNKDEQIPLDKAKVKRNNELRHGSKIESIDPKTNSKKQDRTKVKVKK